MVTIYYRPHQKHRRESAFFSHFQAHFPSATSIRDSFRIDACFLEKFVETGMLINCLRADEVLPKTRRKRCIEVLQDCPAQLKIALSNTQVSFDLVVQESKKTHYWEFHEEQHKNFWNSKTTKVFSPDGLPVNVPRYLQRLVRDVWRIIYFEPYTIVWSDFFESNGMLYKPALSSGFREFYKDGEFSFRRFCQKMQR